MALLGESGDFLKKKERKKRKKKKTLFACVMWVPGKLFWVDVMFFIQAYMPLLTNSNTLLVTRRKRLHSSTSVPIVASCVSYTVMWCKTCRNRLATKNWRFLNNGRISVFEVSSEKGWESTKYTYANNPCRYIFHAPYWFLTFFADINVHKRGS